MFHSFDEVDVDLSAGGAVRQSDRQWHAVENFTDLGSVELGDVVSGDVA